MRKTTAALLLIILLISVSCYSGRKASQDTIVKPFSGSTGITDGSAVYGLPRTVFNIKVEMERTIEIPGPYWRYAGDLLGLDKVIREPNEYWSVASLRLETTEELDPSQFYIIEGSSVMESNALALRKEGLIMDLNPEIYRNAGSGRGENASGGTGLISSDLGSDEYFQVQRDTAFRRVSVDSTFIRIPYIVEKKRKLPADQLAERAAKRLMEMRDGKHLILTGEANVFPQSDAAINEMNRLEREYTELFTGKTIHQERSFTFQVIPAEAMKGKPVTLFRFSELTGPVAEGEGTGDPVVMELTPEKKTSDLRIVERTTEGKEEVQRQDKLYYRVPDVASVKISLGKEVLFNSRRLVYQYGNVVQLPANHIIGK